jgi:hypothetical protein
VRLADVDEPGRDVLGRRGVTRRDLTCDDRIWAQFLSAVEKDRAQKLDREW